MGIPVERIVRATTKIKIRNHESFTSVDIANEVKSHGIWVRNRDVAERLNQCVDRWAKEEGEEYTQEIITVDVGGFGMRRAKAYIPSDGSVSSDYLKRDQRAISPEHFDRMHKTSVMPWNSRSE